MFYSYALRTLLTTILIAFCAALSSAQTALPPAIISGPAVEPDTAGALILWKTDKPGDSVVLFGASSTLGDSAKTAADTVGVTDHRVSLTGLTALTRYFYRVRTTDAFGRTTVGAIDSFKTRGVPDTSPLELILGPFEIDVTPNEAIIIWKTDKRGNSLVEFGTDTLSGSATDAGLDLKHQVTLTGLTAAKTYLYRVSSTGAGHTAVSDTFQFTTPAVLDTLPPVVTVLPTVDSFSVTDTTAIISWGTDAGSDSRVLYWKEGTTDTLTAVEPISKTDHRVVLTRLMPDTRYAYIAQSTRLSNGRFVKSRRGRFTTLPAGKAVDLNFLIAPELVYSTDTRAVFRWKTNLPSDGFVFFAPDPTGNGTFDFAKSFVRGSTEFAREHTVSVGGLTPGMSYIFVITSAAANGRFLLWPPNTTFAKVIKRGALRILAPTGIQQTPGSEGRFITDSAPDTQEPIILSGPTVVGRTANQLIIQWETDEISTSEVQFGTGGALTDRVKDPRQVTFHQIRLTNLEPNTSYDFRIGSTDPLNNGPAQSPQMRAATSSGNDITPPSIDPASIKAVWSDTRAAIEWETDEAATSIVAFGTSPDSMTTVHADPATVTRHALGITNLVPSTTYFYRISSVDAHGNGPTPSNTKIFTSRATPDTAQPVITNRTVSAVAQGSSAKLILTWTTDRLSNSFVDYDTLQTVGRAVGQQKGTRTHHVEVAGLALDKTYYFKVGSANVFDARVPAPKTFGPLDSIRTPAAADVQPPDAPDAVTAIPGDRAVRIKWTPVSDPSGIGGYTLIRNGVTLITNVTDTTFLDDTAANDTAYQYNVTATDQAGNISGASAATAAVTPGTGLLPSAPAAGAVGDTVSLRPILITGDASPVSGDPGRAVLTYAFQVATDSLFTELAAVITGIAQGSAGNPTHWQVTDPGQPDSSALDSGTRYWWRVRANDGAFDSPWSAKRSFVAVSSKPTAVELASFTAEDRDGAVYISWAVTRTQDQAGFHVYRRSEAGGEFERLTGTLLTGGRAFTFIDADIRINQSYDYMVEAVGPSGETNRFGPITVRAGAPTAFALRQNYPNPFNPTTTIRFELPEPAQVTLRIYNILGQEVVTLLDEATKAAGFHTISWDGRNTRNASTAGGVYFYRLEAGGFTDVKKMLLLK